MKSSESVESSDGTASVMRNTSCLPQTKTTSTSFTCQPRSPLSADEYSDDDLRLLVRVPSSDEDDSEELYSLPRKKSKLLLQSDNACSGTSRRRLRIPSTDDECSNNDLSGLFPRKNVEVQ